MSYNIFITDQGYSKTNKARNRCINDLKQVDIPLASIILDVNLSFTVDYINEIKHHTFLAHDLQMSKSV